MKINLRVPLMISLFIPFGIFQLFYLNSFFSNISFSFIWIGKTFFSLRLRLSWLTSLFLWICFLLCEESFADAKLCSTRIILSDLFPRIRCYCLFFFFWKSGYTFLSVSFLSIFTNHSYILGYESCGSHNTTISLAIKKSFFFVVFNHNVYKYIWNKSQRVENNVNKLWSLSFPFRSFVVLPFAKRRCVPNAIVSFYFIYAKMLICVIQYFPFITLFYYMCVFSKQDVFILLRKMA